MHKKQGFTLVELSIVLVIIGLITGGVLVGQDMIESAKIRSQIQQIQKYDAALAAFKTKYGWLPGDCGSTCDSRGFGLVSYSAAYSYKEHNGIIEDGYRYNNNREGSATMGMLAGAGMIDANLANYSHPGSVLEAGEVTLSSDTKGRTYWLIGKEYGDEALIAYGDALTPYQAWRLDKLRDDDNPSGGTLRLAGAQQANPIDWGTGWTDNFDTFRSGGNSRYPHADCVEGSGFGYTKTSTTWSFDDNENGQCPVLMKTGI